MNAVMSPFLSRLSLGRDLAPAQSALLAAVLEKRTYAPGAVIVAEGRRFGTLGLVCRGEAVVEKRDPATGEAQQLARLRAGALFGELSFVDGGPASATVRAATECVVLRLDRDRLEAADPEVARPLRDRLFAHASSAAVERLRAAAGEVADARRAHRDERTRRTELGWFLVLIVLLFGIGNVVQRMITPDLSAGLHMASSWGMLLVIVWLCVRFMQRRGAPASEFGLTWTGTGTRVGRALWEGAALGGLAVAAGLGWRLATTVPGEAIASWGSVGTYEPWMKAVFFAAYPLHCFLQELVARGVIQGSLQRYLGESHRAAPTLITAFLFGVFHLHVSVGFALVTFAASLVFGALYARHRTLVGVTLAHWLVGVGSVALGFN